MVWFKVDDGWHKHRKRIRTGLDLEGFAARGLWTDAGSWSSDEGTDGWIPLDVLDYLAPGLGRKLADRLVRSQLWEPLEERDGEEGYQFHDWKDRNPLSEEVEARLAKRSASGILGNHRRWHVDGRVDPRCQYCPRPAAERKSRGRSQPPSQVRSQPESQPESQVPRTTDNGASPPDPSRPDPTPISQSQNQKPTLGGSLTKQDHPHDSKPSAGSTAPVKPPDFSDDGMPRLKHPCPEHITGDDWDCMACQIDHGDRAHHAKRRLSA